VGSGKKMTDFVDGRKFSHKHHMPADEEGAVGVSRPLPLPGSPDHGPAGSGAEPASLTV
jgi:hypothetical protein